MKIPTYCSKCSKEVKDLEDLLFVEETNTKGFCSNKCIMDFYRPYMDYFLNYESKQRDSLGLEFDEVYHHLYSDRDLFDQVLVNPDSSLLYENDIGDKYHLHLKLINTKYFLVICTHYESEPSFVFYKLITENSDLVETFKKMFSSTASSDESDSSFKNISLDEEVMEEINLKKSQQLALLLDRRTENDINFESFEKYAVYMEQTLNDSDEIYENQDEEGDLLITYIKSFKLDGQDFYYVLICQKIEIKDEGKVKDAILPILSFPSVDTELYKFYSIGSKRSSKIKN